MIKIAFFDTKEYDKKIFDEYNVKNGYNFKIEYFETRLTPETAMIATGYEVVCAFVNDIIDEATLNKLKEVGVKIIALRCAGYNNVEIAKMPKDIRLVRVPEYSPYAVAEHAVALMLALNRKIYKAYQRTKKYNFSLDGLLGFDVHGKTVGVIGTGKIGKAFIKIMKGFGTEVIASDTFPDENSAKEIGYKYVSLDELYEKSDIISIHCPLTEKTEKMINESSMSKMKDGVYIINTSRGKIINTKDLIKVLETGKIGGLGLDVYEEEDEFFQTDFSNSYIRNEELSLLLTMPNCIITAHQAFFTEEALNKIAMDTLQNIKDIFEKNDCKNEIKA